MPPRRPVWTEGDRGEKRPGHAWSAAGPAQAWLPRLGKSVAMSSLMTMTKEKE